MNSATSGLYAAIGALGIGFGDEVITSPFTMTACASSALVYGAIPIFADVSPHTGCLDLASIKSKMTSRTRAILVVHQFGIPAEMDGILALARKHNLAVIEDCAQAHGALYKGKPVGALGQIGVFSLNVNKSIQSGEGGICLTSDPELRYRLALIRNHGEAVVEAAGYRNLTNIVGFNYRLTELTAAVALEQLKKLDQLNAVRLAHVNTLSGALSQFPFLVAPPRCTHAPFGSNICEDCASTYYLYPLRFKTERCSVNRRTFAKALNAEGVCFTEGYTAPLYLQPLYQTRQAFKHGYPFSAPENQASQPDYSPGACPVAERLHNDEILINEHVRPPHGQQDILDIVRAIEKVGRCLTRPTSTLRETRQCPIQVSPCTKEP